MLANHIVTVLRRFIKDPPTNSQELLLNNLAEFTMNDDEDILLLVQGYAGTGKTTAISAFVALLLEMKIKFVLLAPTGRAAKVLAAYTDQQAYTIHKKIYRQKSAKDGLGHFVLDRNLMSRTIFIVDEASMISNENQEGSVFGSGRLLDDLIEYVYNGKGCKLMLVGDTGQLPPVGLDVSPALDDNLLHRYSESILKNNLTEVVRQREYSGILHNATLIRKRLETGNYTLPLLDLKEFHDIKRIGGDELIESISENISKYSLNDTVVINRSNKRAIRYNAGIRSSVLFHEEELVPGDLLMIVKNNYFWLQEHEKIDFLANGDIIEIVRIHQHHELYGFRFVDCTVRLSDYDLEMEVKLLLDTLYEEAPALGMEKNKQLFYTILEDYAHLKPKKKQYDSVKSNEYFNALQVKYAYAITCHKSQGGQWKSVYIDQGYITKERIDREYLRWLYTALTRATEKVYLVNFPDYFF